MVSSFACFLIKDITNPANRFNQANQADTRKYPMVVAVIVFGLVSSALELPFPRTRKYRLRESTSSATIFPEEARGRAVILSLNPVGNSVRERSL